MSAEDERRIERTLGRIETLVAAVDETADPAARAAARELLEAVLDLHGLALARVMAMAVAAEGGKALVERLAADEQVSAVLLLYGLHPDTIETRVRSALDRLRPRLEVLGIDVGLTRIDAGTARLRVKRDAGRAGAETDHLRREIEEAIVNAAPDLDAVAIEGLDGQRAGKAAARAG